MALQVVFTGVWKKKYILLRLKKKHPSSGSSCTIFWASRLDDAKDTLPETHICQDGQGAIGEFLTNRGNLKGFPK